ncbi:TPA: hypothetical protein ACKRQV_001212 [Pseudomonas aeruginosa]|nr:hypothetical protein [Pseudomonas aeruginosa]EIU2864257.1 hypothetical protein [Pseudomonas aeruginosa]
MQTLKPQAGDAVILTGDYPGVNPGSIACIGGALSAECGSNVTFAPNIYRDARIVSCGGGPATFELPELHPTTRTVRLPCWRFKDGRAEANNAEYFSVEVPLWEYRGVDVHPVWGEQSVDVLLADRLLLNEPFNRFPANWDRVEVFRGEFCITNIPNRPNHDYMGKKLSSLYRQRQLLRLVHHHMFSVGCGYRFTVTVGGGTAFTAFRTQEELDRWLKAYGLRVLGSVRRDYITESVIVPNAEFKTWQKLLAEHQPVE